MRVCLEDGVKAVRVVNGASVHTKPSQPPSQALSSVAGYFAIPIIGLPEAINLLPAAPLRRPVISQSDSLASPLPRVDPPRPRRFIYS